MQAKPSFWKQLNKPFFVLAPMADVTDSAFRRIIAKYGKPDVTWTEFVSADGLIRATPEGKRKLLKDLEYSESERPIVAQLFSSNPEYIEEASVLCKELGFDGIDINMGCPDKSIEKQGCGAGMIRNPEKAVAVIRAAQKSGLPVSVKTRIGYNKNEIDTWIPKLLECNIEALTIHCRTRKEMSKVPARWEHVREVVEIRNKMGVDTLIIGNGDLIDIEDARKKCEEFGADGAMLGRAIFGNPWLFSSYFPKPGERLKVLIEHTKLFEELLGGVKNFALMKKHFKSYLAGIEGSHDLRLKLMETENASEVEALINKFLKNLEK